MKFYNPVIGFAFGVIALVATGCGVLQNNSAQPTRAATQTPFIVFVPVTTTPEPATVTPLPTVTSAVTQTPAKTATTARVVSSKPTATKTKAPAAPVATGPTATSAPVCTSDPIIPTDPGDSASVLTFAAHPGSGSFIFKWATPANAGGDDFGYKIQMNSTTIGGKPAGGDTLYISHNTFISDNQKQNCPGRQSCLVYDGQHVWGLKGSEDTNVSWYIAAVRFTGTIDDQYHLSPGGKATECTGSKSSTRIIRLIVQD